MPPRTRARASHVVSWTRRMFLGSRSQYSTGRPPSWREKDRGEREGTILRRFLVEGGKLEERERERERTLKSSSSSSSSREDILRRKPLDRQIPQHFYRYALTENDTFSKVLFLWFFFPLLLLREYSFTRRKLYEIPRWFSSFFKIHFSTEIFLSNRAALKW